MIESGIDIAKLDSIEKACEDELDAAYDKSKGLKYAMEDWENDQWESIKDASKYGDLNDTGVKLESL